MSKIEIGRFSELLRRTLGMKGQQTVAAELSPEVSPVIELESAEDQEWDFLKGVRQVSWSAQIAANVGAAGQGQLRNPPGSGVLAVVTNIEMAGVSAQQFAITFNRETIDLTNTALTVARDGRWQTTSIFQQSALIATFRNATGAVPVGAGTIYISGRDVRVPVHYSQQIVMPPGSNLIFGGISANDIVWVSCDWHERQIPALEL